MTTEPTLNISSNLMIVENQPEYKYVPGDLVGKIYPQYVDVRVMRDFLSPEQIIEREQYLICEVCGKPCAGNCKNR